MRATVASREQTHAWELRTAWGLGRETIVLLDPDRADVMRIRGYVSRVSPTGAWALMEDAGVDAAGRPCAIQFLCAHVLGVRRPHFHEDAPRPDLDRFKPKRLETNPDQLPLFEE